MTEDQLVRALLAALSWRGWMACHFRPARTAQGWRTAITGHAGAPDIIAIHPDLGALFIEAKSDTGKLRPEQVPWRDAGVSAASKHDGITYLVARPADWLAGRLDDALGITGKEAQAWR